MFRSAPSSTRSSQRILDSSNTMEFRTWQIFHSTSSDRHHGMFLRIMTFARNVSKYIMSIAQPYFGYLTWSWIRFFRCSRRNTRAYSLLLRTFIRSSSTVCAPFLLSTMTNRLIRCRHRSFRPSSFPPDCCPIISGYSRSEAPFFHSWGNPIVEINEKTIMDRDPNGSILLGGTAQGEEEVTSGSEIMDEVGTG